MLRTRRNLGEHAVFVLLVHIETLLVFLSILSPSIQGFVPVRPVINHRKLSNLAVTVPVSHFQHQRGGTLSSLFFDDNDDEECSIYNLDACMGEISEDELEPVAYSLDTHQESIDRSLKQLVSMPIVEVVIALLVLLSSFLVGVGTLQSLPPIVASLTQMGELIISVIFMVEYAIRWKLHNFSAKYVVQPLTLIDLVAIIPGLMEVVDMMGIAVPPSLLGGALINLRLLRILRLQRVLTDYETFHKFEQALGLNPSDTRPYQLQLARVVISIFTLLSVTAGLIYSAEHVVNPEIPDYYSALYFALTTLTTVGFGDIHPMTTAGRWVVSGSILIGVAVIPAQAAALVEALLNRADERDSKKDKTAAASITSNDDETLPRMMARMQRIEEKLDETNARIDQVLDALEEQAKIKQLE